MIQYFTDGCAKQYKNKKNFLNMTYHYEDFGVVANWAFSATSNGKGPWDGVAGSAKREAALESLRRPEENQIQTAHDFFKFVKEKFKKLVVEFIPTEDINKLEDDILEERFKAAKTIQGTLGFHNYESIPDNHKKVKVKKFSLSDTVKTVSVVKCCATNKNSMPVQPEQLGVDEEGALRAEVGTMNDKARGLQTKRGNKKKSN